MTNKWNPGFFLHLFSAFLSALGLQLLLIDMLGLSSKFTWISTSIFCAAAMFILLLMTYRFSIVLAGFAGLALPVLLLSIFSDVFKAVYEFISQFFMWLGPYIMGTKVSSSGFELTLFIALVSIISLLCFIFACLLENSLFQYLLISIPVIVLSIIAKKPMHYYLLLPSVFGIILLFSLTGRAAKYREEAQYAPHHGYWQTLLILIPALAVGLIVSASTADAIPSDSLRSSIIMDSTNDILSAVHLPLPSTATRTAFNLGGLGYYPLHERLGGPVYIPDTDIMEVTASTDLLLRAATYDKYETTFWSSTNFMFSSRLNSDTVSSRAKEFFDMNRPDTEEIPPEIYNKVIDQHEVTVKNKYVDIGTTLFSADHLLSFSNPGNTVYYNNSAELFQNEPVRYNQSYTFTFSHFRTLSPTYREDLLTLEAYILAHPDTADQKSRLKAIQEDYLDPSVPESVADYALSLTADAITPLEKVFAIREVLLSDYTYSLDVEVPPADSDFVEFFLSTRTGYCTYFASAMAVMAQINGIPARYVEGFVVDEPVYTSVEDPATVTVTAENGHAWCEVYISGIGWIPVDATASSLPGGGALSEGDSQGTDLPSDIPAYIPPEEGYIPTNGTNIPVAGTDESGGFGAYAAALFKVLILPLVLAAWLLIGIYIYLARRRWNKYFAILSLEQLAGQMSPEDIIMYLWGRSLCHLSLLYAAIEPDETASDFAKRLQSIAVYASGCKMDTYRFDLQIIAGIHDRWIYGRKYPSLEEIEKAYSECSKLAGDVFAAHKSQYTYLIHFLIHPKNKPGKEAKAKRTIKET